MKTDHPLPTVSQTVMYALLCVATSYMCPAFANGPTPAGDRGHHVNMVYPPDAFHQNGGPIVDITQAPYHAKGSGDPEDATHNTRAFIAVYDFLMKELDKYGDMDRKVTQPSSTECSYIVYIPDGIYYVNDTLIYSGPIRRVKQVQREYCVWLRFFGQSRRGTIIRLQDNCPGFADKKNPKHIFAFGKKLDVNPMKANNAIKNMTINVGRGNPGAIGIKWTSANNGVASELLITSSDGQGFSGYDFTVGGPCGYFRDIIVNGFDYGIRIGTHARRFYNPVLEYISLKNQKKAGLLCESGSGTLRKIKSENTVPTIVVSDCYSHAVILDSQFVNGDPSNAAIDIINENYGIGHVFARNIAVSGYKTAVKKDGVAEHRGPIREYVSDPTKTYAPDTLHASLNLPIEELPYIPWEQDLSKWVTAGTGGRGSDDTAAIQRAMNDTSKSVFYFPQRMYGIRGGIDIPPHIKVIDFMFCKINGSIPFRINQAAPDPIYFRDLCKSSRARVFIEQNCNRTVVTELIPGRFGNPGNHPGAKAFLCSTSIARDDKDYGIKNTQLFWRWGNDEYRERLFNIGENCTVVMLGYKTEGGGIGFTIANNSKVEILGGVHTNHGRPKWYTEPYPYIKNKGGDLSLITRFMQGARTYQNYIQETHRGTTSAMSSDEFPALGTESPFERIIPLYTNHKRQQPR